MLVGNRKKIKKNVESNLEEACNIGENEDSKVIYINDSYNLDTIPFDVDEIIDTDNNITID